MLVASLQRAIPRLSQTKHTHKVICRQFRGEPPMVPHEIRPWRALRVPWHDRLLKDRLYKLVKPACFALTASGGGAVLVKYLRNTYPEAFKDSNTQTQRAIGSAVIWSIVIANFATFFICDRARWRNWRRVLRFQKNYMFVNLAGKAPVRSMVGSLFNHDIRLTFNMILFFMVAREIKSDPLAILQVYFTGGVIAVFASYVHQIVVPSVLPSKTCGGAAAVLALLAYVATKYPGTMVSIPPFDIETPHQIPIKYVFYFYTIKDLIFRALQYRMVSRTAHFAAYCGGIVMTKSS